MINITLSDVQYREVLSLFKTTDKRHVRNRCQAVLLTARGDSRDNVAEALGITKRTLQRWLNEWLRAGVEGLDRKYAPGKTPIIPEAIHPEIISWIRGGPQSVQLERANWTFSELAVHLYKTHGIKVNTSTIERLCKKKGVRLYRPTYRFLRANAEKQCAAAQELVALKK